VAQVGDVRAKREAIIYEKYYLLFITLVVVVLPLWVSFAELLWNWGWGPLNFPCSSIYEQCIWKEGLGFLDWFVNVLSTYFRVCLFCVGKRTKKLKMLQRIFWGIFKFFPRLRLILRATHSIKTPKKTSLCLGY